MIDVDVLGWTDDALAEAADPRGWTREAIDRLELTWLDPQHRVGIPVRDETGADLGELRYDPTGQLTPKMLADHGVPRVLFPPPEAVGNDEPPDQTLWLVEGEPDAIRAWSLGLPAVAVPGAQSWRDEWAARFTGRHWRIAVCFDCDTTGRTHATRAAEALARAGLDVRLIDLDPSREDGYDLTDWTRLADTSELRQQAAAALLAIADGTSSYEPTIGPPEEQLVPERPWRSVPWSTFRDSAPPEQHWLIEGLLPTGALAFVAGPPKRGKTWVGLGLSLCLSLGRAWLGRHSVPQARDVLYCALEGSQTGLRTRIGALARGAGADPDTDDLETLHMLYRPRPFNLADLATADWLLTEAAETDAALIVVDVLRAAARFQENAAEDFARIREHLDPLLAEGRTVALLHHFGKLTETQKERSPGERMAGTGAMYGALDVGFLITRSEDHARRLRLTIEARDFAAPDALELVVDGNGSGQYGGFTYTDTATLTEEEIIARDLVAEAVELLTDREQGMSRDDLADKLGVGWKELKGQIDADEQRRVEHWTLERDGRFPDGPSWNYAPFLTPELYARAKRGDGAQQSLVDESNRSVQAGPSGPSDAPTGSVGRSVPLSGDRPDRATTSRLSPPGPSEPSDPS